MENQKKRWRSLILLATGLLLALSPGCLQITVNLQLPPQETVAAEEEMAEDQDDELADELLDGKVIGSKQDAYK